MTSTTLNGAKPAITLTRTDCDQLWQLAESHAKSNPDLVEELFAELARAQVVEDTKIASDVVRMGTTLRFTSDLGEDRRVTLVFPNEADIKEGKISILTPIGTALIGLSAGQSIAWAARDGRTHRLSVVSVENPDPEPVKTGTNRAEQVQNQAVGV